MAFIHCTFKTHYSLTVQLEDLQSGGWTEADGDRLVYWYVTAADLSIDPWNIPSDQWEYQDVVPIWGVPSDGIGGEYIISGLKPGTTYYIRAIVRKDDSSMEIINDKLFGTATTLDGNTTIEEFTITSTVGLLPVDVYIKIKTESGFIWELSTQKVGETAWVASFGGIKDYNETNNGVFTWSRTGFLKAWNFGDRVKFKLEITTLDGTFIEERIITVTFTDVPPRPSNWTWTTAIKSGETRAFDGKEIHPVTAAEWNRFVTRVNEFRDYCGLSLYEFVSVSPGDEIKSAYNTVVATIRAMGYSTAKDLPDIDSNTSLSPILFQRLATELNKIP